MEVFYVMVLVLVARAVPCHGRTESEGTVFNKTQPHESMNNVTVSSSKLETYGDLFLVMQWPRSFCYFNRCYRQTLPPGFTVHGLWPQPQPQYDPLRLGINCLHIYPRYPSFNLGQLRDPNLLLGMNKYWPDLKSTENRGLRGHNNERFWGREYNKHGSCTFDNQNVYFGLTITLVEQYLGVLTDYPSQIIGRGISSDNFYTPGYIRDAVRRVTNKMPILHCFQFGNYYYLLEIYFCADVNNNQLRDCNWYSDCGYETDRRVYVPPP